MNSDGISNGKKKILIICNYYLPGYKSGGGLRTLVHMVERFKDKFDFYVVTGDHDGDETPYTSVKINDWNEVEGARVFYLSKEQIKLSKLRELVNEVKPDSIYLNSVFSTLTIFLLINRRLKLIPPIEVILAPEGELSDGALQLKATKKRAFIKFAKGTGLYRNLIWKTTAEPEKAETERFKGSGGKVYIAPNVPSRHLLKDYNQELKPQKTIGNAKMIFLSRFMRKKNFKWLVDNLKGIEGTVEIDVYGPLEDEEYWRETQVSIEKLPKNIQVNYKGHIEYDAVGSKLFEYHFFVLPTVGENFGHVFIEALSAGCPLIISDRTPWVDLEKEGIGWDIPLESPEKWNEIFNYCIKLDQLTYRKLSENSRHYANQWLSNPKVEEDTLKVLQFSLEKSFTKAT